VAGNLKRQQKRESQQACGEAHGQAVEAGRKDYRAR
jgi:hypothetical protein